MSQAPRCPAGCEKQAHCPCCSLRTAAAAAAARTTDVARGGSKQRQQFGGGARAGAMALSHHLLLLLLLFVALQARPLHAAPLRAWGADGGHALRRPPAARLDAGVEPLGQPADGNLKSTSAALPQPPAPQPRGHRRGPPTGKYSGEGAKTSFVALKNLQIVLKQLEGGQDVAISGNADTPGQEQFKVDVQHLQHWGAPFLLTVVGSPFLLILVLVLCCSCLKKAMGKGSADPAHQLETGSFPSSLENERSCPDTAKVSVCPPEAVAVEHPPSPLETGTLEHAASPQETSTVGRPPSPQPSSTSTSSMSSRSILVPPNVPINTIQTSRWKWTLPGRSHRAKEPFKSYFLCCK
ncbi:uncharacterized protein LOC135182211 [Pogoniulus pusillus]|uniref:uncharacterized protein LOC135182211 n=1 Tax=Pogoniulus pusillus TaxID=488313 RepID=UPI0030B97231